MQPRKEILNIRAFSAYMIQKNIKHKNNFENLKVG